MKIKLIHIECGRFNGIVNYKFNDKILRFELGTPNFNDYGEFRISTDFEILDYDKIYEGYIPKNMNCDIDVSYDQYEWWLSENRIMLPYINDNQISGGKTENNDIVIYNKENELVKYSEWEGLEHDPYEHIMYNIFYVFYNWYMSDDCLLNNNGLMIY